MRKYGDIYNMSDFKLKENTVYVIDGMGSGNISNSNITNEKAISFLKVNINRIKLFSIHPSNWEELAGVEKTVNYSQKELEVLKLEELRGIYPNITARSKSDFIKKILKNDKNTL